MINVSHCHRYLPHDLLTRKHVVALIFDGFAIDVVRRRYKVSRSSIWRWMKRFDGSDASLKDRSHTPLSRHPSAHTDEEIKWIYDLRRRKPEYSYLELWIRLRQTKGYARHPCSLYRILVRDLGYKKHPYVKYKPKPYDTPRDIGIKWQIDTKYVPLECKSGRLFDKKFYQFTLIDECSRRRFLYWYDECTPFNSCDFLLKALAFFAYMPQEIQSDNGFEFTYTNRKAMQADHPFRLLCEKLGIRHHLIRPRTPRHNGKVERSHRTDNEKFYAALSFFSLDDLRLQGKLWNKRYNDIPKAVLCYKTPNEIEKLKLAAL